MPKASAPRTAGAFPCVCAAALIGLLCIGGSGWADAAIASTGLAGLRSGHGALDAPAIRQYLADVHGIGPGLREQCGGRAALQDLRIAYARLLGTAEEQALVEATSCAMGNGGADLVLVLRQGARRQIVPLKVDDSARPIEELYAGQRRTPRVEARGGRLVRWFVKADPQSDTAAIRREITYRWAGDRFVIDTVRDLPEAVR